MSLSQIRDSASRWLASSVPASPLLQTYPGWRLGSGERRSGSLATWFRRQLWYGISSPVLTPWLEGLRVYAYPQNELSRCVFVTGRYEPNEFYFLARILKPGMTFVDVGANVGLYSLFASRKVGDNGQVLAIEPSSRECERLLRNVRVNSVSNIRLVRKAVSDSSGYADLLVAADVRSGHNTLGALTSDTPLAMTEKVPTERLDAIVSQEHLSRLDIMKLDIEGAEFKALQGAAEVIERFRPILLLECADSALGHQGSSSTQVWEFLHQRQYRIYKFDPRTGAVIAGGGPEHQGENIIAAPESTDLT